MNVNDKLIVQALASSECANEVFNVEQTNKFIASKARGGDVLSSINTLPDINKNAILRTLCDKKMLVPCEKYAGTIPHGFRFKEAVSCGMKLFPKETDDMKSNFQFNVPIDSLSTYNGFQILRIITAPPKLSAKYGNRFIGQDGNLVEGVKFRYTKKPGIRALREISLVSNSIVFEKYTWLDALKYDDESITNNTWEVWNNMIGHDLGREATIYNPFLNSEVVTNVKTGNQTPTHIKGGLELHIPLLFDFGRNFSSKLNTTGILPDTLKVEGILERSNLMVTADFYDDDITVPPEPLECEQLEITDFTLFTESFFVDDYLHAVVNGLDHSSFVRYWDSATYCIPDRDPCEDIRIKGNSNTESYTVCARPKSYRTHFDLWTELTEVEKICTPSCIITPSAPGVFNQVSVVPAISYSPTKSLLTLKMEADGYELKPELPSECYGKIEHYKMARNHPKYHPRNFEVYKFNYNYLHKEEYLTGALPQGKFEDVYIQYKFDPKHLDEHSLLVDEWEFIIFRDIFSKRMMSKSNLITRYQI